MRRGGLKQSLKVLRRTTHRSFSGSDETTYELVRVIRAERTRLSGNLAIQCAERFGALTADFNVDIHHDVKVEDRVQETKLVNGELIDGVTFVVLAVLDDPRLKLKTLICANVNS